jgi:hypothetical protein
VYSNFISPAESGFALESGFLTNLKIKFPLLAIPVLDLASVPKKLF